MAPAWSGVSGEAGADGVVDAGVVGAGALEAAATTRGAWGLSAPQADHALAEPTPMPVPAAAAMPSTRTRRETERRIMSVVLPDQAHRLGMTGDRLSATIGIHGRRQ
jgi:hypothetical protein